ncbi:hypothetical protein BH11VER1_BH11VER1_41440 [soil metagenome]
MNHKKDSSFLKWTLLVLVVVVLIGYCVQPKKVFTERVYNPDRSYYVDIYRLKKMYLSPWGFPSPSRGDDEAIFFLYDQFGTPIGEGEAGLYQTSEVAWFDGSVLVGVGVCEFKKAGKESRDSQ